MSEVAEQDLGDMRKKNVEKEGGLASARIHHLMVFDNSIHASSFYIIIKKKPSNFNNRNFQLSRLPMEDL